MRVTLNRDDIALCIAMAIESSKRWAEKEGHKGHYEDTATTHLVGRLGELGAERAFVQLGFTVDPHWRYGEEREKWCDIQIGALRIDAKAWRVHWWHSRGRSIAVNQFPALARKADVVVWLVVHSEWAESTMTIEKWRRVDDVDVEVKGYSTIEDIQASRSGMSEHRRHKVDNYRVDEEKDLEQLVAYLDKQYPGRIPLPPPPPKPPKPPYPIVRSPGGEPGELCCGEHAGEEWKGKPLVLACKLCPKSSVYYGRRAT